VTEAATGNLVAGPSGRSARRGSVVQRDRPRLAWRFGRDFSRRIPRYARLGGSPNHGLCLRQAAVPRFRAGCPRPAPAILRWRSHRRLGKL